MLVSICICTYNRAAVLAHCLQSIARLTDPKPAHSVEVIVIDNNSTDETSRAVQQLIPGFPFKMRYVFEGRQGISAARNRAIEEAKGDYLAFLDDECTIGPDWISVAISIIEEFQPLFIGGPYVGALLPGEHPKWFKVEYGNAPFLRRDLDRGFHHDFRASAGNMLAHRKVLEDFRFDVGLIALGMEGGRLNLGEETELQDRFLRSNNSEGVFYEPALRIRHFILPYKMKLSYRAKRVFLTAFGKPVRISSEQFLLAVSKVMLFTMVSPFRCLFRDRKRYPHWQNDAYERAIPQIFFHSGTIAKYLRDLWADLKSSEAVRYSL